MRFLVIAIPTILVTIFSAFVGDKRVSSVTLSNSKPVDTVAITGATLIDGSGRAPIKDTVVIIKGDSIIAVGKRGRINIPADARVIDAHGLVIAPGQLVRPDGLADRERRDDGSDPSRPGGSDVIRPRLWGGRGTLSTI